MRALAIIRLSELSDETTSPARQREIVAAAALARGADVIGWAEDLDVSASRYAPADRPQLGAWLQRPDEFDVLIFWRTDRFVRKVADFADMIRWAQAHGKNLISATEPFDLATPMGKAMAYLTAIFAEMEASNTSERVTGAHDYLRRAGRWGGGRWPYGYRTVPNPEGAGYILVIDPKSAELVREAMRRAVAGESVSSIAADWTEKQVATPLDHQRFASGLPLKCACGHTGHDGMECERCGCGDYRPVRAAWHPDALFRILRSEALLGHVIHNGETITGAEGMPMTRAEPLITYNEWTQLQAAASRQETIRTRTSSLLLSIAYCGKCQAPLYKLGERGRVPRYRCSSRNRVPHNYCGAPNIPLAELDQMAAQIFLGQVGRAEMHRRVYQPGYDPSGQAALVRRSLESARAEYDSGQYEYPGGQDEYAARTAALSARLKDLLSQPVSPAGYVSAPTGELIGDLWHRLREAGDIQGQRQLMMQSGFKVYARRMDGMPSPVVTFEIDPELEARAVAAAEGRPVTNASADPEALARVLGPLQE